MEGALCGRDGRHDGILRSRGRKDHYHGYDVLGGSHTHHRNYQKVLEDAGYSVKVVSFSEWGIAYAALTKGDIQIMASQTDYAAQDYWDKNKRRLEKISPVSHGLYQAIAVPKYVTIDSIDQLNDNTEKFGGKIVGIEPGSGLMRDAASAVKEYGLKLPSSKVVRPR